MLKKHGLVVGPFQCNCSILVCEKTKEAVVIDAGDEFDRIESALKKLDVKVKYSIHTHAHLDHIGAAGDLKKYDPKIQIALHKDDEDLYLMLQKQGELFGIEYQPPPPLDKRLVDEETLQIGENTLKVIHTPGHSPGGICLHFNEGVLGDEPVIFSGDTLFQQSIGRTDLWGADHRQLIKSIKQRLFTLPEDTLVLPGHGGTTRIGLEKRENPFLN
jgi:hydroxyacylglutathione hydrolase